MDRSHALVAAGATIAGLAISQLGSLKPRTPAEPAPSAKPPVDCAEEGLPLEGRACCALSKARCPEALPSVAECAYRYRRGIETAPSQDESAKRFLRLQCATASTTPAEMRECGVACE